MKTIMSAVVAALVFVMASTSAQVQQLQTITLNYPTRSGASWPLFIAKEGGYYQKHGLDVTLIFAGHPAGIAMVVSDQAQMSSYNLESVMQASSRGEAPFTVVGSSVNKPFFALMSRKDIAGVKDLKGKTIAVSQIGDPPYNYTSAFLRTFGLTARDVQWIAAGADANGRAAALASGRADATLLTPPAYFRLEEAGYKNLGNLADHDDIFAATTYLMKKSTVASNPRLPELLIKAHAEAIKRFYDDKAFAVKAYQTYDKQTTADVERFYDGYAKANVLERVPYVLTGAVQAVIDQQSDSKLLAQMKGFDFHGVIDNSVVARLVKEAFFQQLFGPGIKAEEERKAKLAFK
ncbi:MAG TPA: ABC transporter substrate-binding protein [Vicinamibacterales bacterium]|nr:ABC transporter substrate-binding protein [Vicinamibacterales bacterium]